VLVVGLLTTTVFLLINGQEAAEPGVEANAGVTSPRAEGSGSEELVRGEQGEGGASRPTEKPTQEAQPPAYRCWDGSPARKLDSCGRPEGARGVAWVFPKFDETNCLAGLVPADSPRLRIWQCRYELSDGALVKVNFTEWKRYDRGFADYDNEAEVSRNDVPVLGSREVVRHHWLRFTGTRYKVARMYKGEPWSATLYALTPEQRAAGVREVLQMRPWGQLRGGPNR
jgi:hypothetical protein